MEKTFFGKTSDGRDVYKYTVSNSVIELSVLDYGATIYSLKVPDVDNNPTDIVLIPRDLCDIEALSPYMGATVGRYANRIRKSEFYIEGEKYILAANENANCLHGGVYGFDKKIWNASEIENGIKFSLLSEDGDQGFPGNLLMDVRFILSENALIIAYDGVSDKPTYINMTNHSYFNLNGHDSGVVTNHTISVNSDFYIPIDENLLPTGEILKSKGTKFDLKDGKKLTEKYDHCFVLADSSKIKYAASLYGDISGITMTTYTTKPGIQIYRNDCLANEFIGKNGEKYPNDSFVCLETEFFPDSPSYAHFSNALFKNQEIYSHKTIYKFD